MATFTYNENSPTSTRDRVRLALGDVDGSVTTGPRSGWTFYITDAEIDQLLSDNGSVVLLAAAAGADMIRGRYLMEHPDVKLGPFSTGSQAAAYWRGLAADLRARAETDGDFEVAPVAWDETSSQEVTDYKTARGEDN